MSQSLRIAQFLSAGILFTCLGRVPYGFLQGAGRPDITGILHILEFPIYIAVVLFAIRLWGVNGVAMTWALRAFVDAGCLFLFSQRLLGDDRLEVKRKLILIIAVIAIFSTLAMIDSISCRVVGYILVLMTFVFVTIKYGISEHEKSFLISLLTLKKS